jgi:enoyl-CoA hydratase/carnithine racemase
MNSLRPEYMHPSDSLKATKFELLPGGIAVVTLDRPSALNSLSAALNFEVEHHFKWCDLASEVRAVLLTGNPESKTRRGQTIFCAGADLAPEDGGGAFSGDKRSSAPASEGEAAKPSPAATHRDGGGLLSLAINRCRKPVIAAINGTAVGGGLSPTLAADIRIVSDSAQLGFVFARRGIVPEAACGYFLPKLVGISKALEWCMTGRVFAATEAEGTGLFNHLLPEEEVLPKALEVRTLPIDSV